MRYLLDTNVVIDYLKNDSGGKFLDLFEDENTVLVVNIPVLMEVYYYLNRRLKISLDECVDTIKSFLLHSNVECEEILLALNMLNVAKEKKIDLVDALLITKSVESKSKILSYDAKVK